MILHFHHCSYSYCIPPASGKDRMHEDHELGSATEVGHISVVVYGAKVVLFFDMCK